MRTITEQPSQQVLLALFMSYPDHAHHLKASVSPSITPTSSLPPSPPILPTVHSKPPSKNLFASVADILLSDTDSTEDPLALCMDLFADQKAKPAPLVEPDVHSLVLGWNSTSFTEPDPSPTSPPIQHALSMLKSPSNDISFVSEAPSCVSESTSCVAEATSCAPESPSCVSESPSDAKRSFEEPKCGEWHYSEDCQLVDIFTSVAPENHCKEISRRLPKRRLSDACRRFQRLCGQMVDRDDEKCAVTSFWKRQRSHFKPKCIIAKTISKSLAKLR